MSDHVLMQADGGNGSTMKLATRRLDNVGYIKAHSGLANEPLCLKIMNNCNILSASMEVINWITAALKEKKRKDKHEGLMCCVP